MTMRAAVAESLSMFPGNKELASNGGWYTRACFIDSEAG